MVWADPVTQMVGVMCPAASEATHNVDYNLISTKTPDPIAMMREAGKIPLKTGDLFGVDVSLKRKAGVATPNGCGSWATTPRPRPGCFLKCSTYANART